MMKIKMDFLANRKNTKGLIFIVFFRISNFFTQHFILKIIGFPIRFLYKFIVQWVLGCDISDTTNIGEGFSVFHGQGLIINSEVIIGKNVIVRQNTTIGNSTEKSKCPIIGDNVNIGANSVLIGEIKIGNNSIIGAGSVVVKDVKPYHTVVGNPAVSLGKVRKMV